MKVFQFEKVNVIWGAVATIGAAVFGKYWFLFLGFLILNIVDYATGIIKAKYYQKNESSAVGAIGVLKKLMYWVVIGIAFFIADCFVQFGEIINVNLSFLLLLGWLVLASYLINEIRSILENCVLMEIKVPEFLIDGLEVTEKLIKSKTEIKNEDKEGKKNER